MNTPGRPLKRIALACLVVSPFVYVLAGIIVVMRQHLSLTGSTIVRVVGGADSIVLGVLTALPLIEAAAVVWFLSLRADQQPAREQRARLLGSVVAVLAVLAFALFSAEEGLAAPILHLSGASTSVFAFFFLPPYALVVFGLTFGILWSLTHVVGHLMRRTRPGS